MTWIYYLILIAMLCVGWFINIVGLPGLWLMIAAYGVYAWMTGWNIYVGWASLLAMLLLAVAAEVAEFLAGAAGSKAAGGRRRGMIGAIIGGFVGAIFFTGLVPIPIVGTIIGVCLGTFIGAAVIEYGGKDLSHSMRVGVGAAKGRFWGIVSKSLFGLAMLIVGIIGGWPRGAATFTATGGTISSPPPATLPIPATTTTTTTAVPRSDAQ
jgi:uncharacterized protein